MAALLLLTNTQPGRTADWVISLLLAWLATSAILLSATYLFRWLGESVLTALERVMGMLLIALSVQMFMAGVASFLHLNV
jgi:multiple antibiotic resistance protein